MQRYISIALSLCFLVTADVALAEPKFDYKTVEVVKDVKDVDWDAAIRAGLLLTRGNSETTTLSAGTAVKRRAGDNQFQLAADLAYGRSSILLADDANGSGTLEPGEISRISNTTTELWAINARYDRFLNDLNSVYGSGNIGSNKPAGKELVGGGQLGYSHIAFKSDEHTFTLEAGYDFTHEKLDVGDGVSIHSARFFAGHIAKLGEATTATTSAELLINLNELDTPTGKAEITADTRVNAGTAITTKIWENLSFSFAFSLRYDGMPAPRPAFKIPYAPGFLPVADEVDTKTEASLIYTFL